MIRSPVLKRWRWGLRGFSSSMQGPNELVEAACSRKQLLAMYCRCGRLDEARSVLESMPDKDVVCWTLVISGYGRQGRTRDALRLLHRMPLEGVKPDMVTLASALSACCVVGPAGIRTGKQIEAWIAESGHELNAVLGTALVNMYARCGSPGGAWRAFEQMSQRNVVAWTVMLAACATQEQALQAFGQMQLEGFKPNGFTLVAILSACGAPRAEEEELGQRQRLCTMIVENGLESGNVIVATALISLISKCGKVEEARRVFHRIPLAQRDVVAWNAILAAHVEESGESGLELFQRMQLEGVRPNRVTFTTLLTFTFTFTCTCRRVGQMVHAQAAESGLDRDVVVGTALLGMYSECGRVDDAVRVFEGIDKQERDVLCWNAMISALLQQRDQRIREAFSCYRQMKLQGVQPDRGTFAMLLLSSSSSSEMISEIAQRGLDADAVVSNAILNTHAKLGRLEDAVRVFQRMKEQGDVVSWNAMLSAYVGAGRSEEAIGLFRRMQQQGMAPNSITVATIFSAYAECSGLDAACGDLLLLLGGDPAASSKLILTACAQQGRGRDALRLFRLMLQQGIQVDCITLSAAISSCASLAALKEGKAIHSAALLSGADPRIIGNALVDMYAKCGSLGDALWVFSEMQQRDVVSWTAIIAGYAQAGVAEQALHLFRAMKLEGVTPDAITFITILSLCSHAGLVEEGCRVFASIAADHHHHQPTSEHYSCLIDLLGRAGRVAEAESFVQQLPFQPDLLIWTALLSACTSQGDAERGQRAAQHVLRLYPRCSSGYVALSNIFSSPSSSQANKP